MKKHYVTSPKEERQQQQGGILQLDEEHRQRRESADRRFAEATEAIIAEAFESGDEDIIMLSPDADERVHHEEADDHGGSGVENRLTLRPRMRRLGAHHRHSSQTSYDYLTIDFNRSGRDHLIFQQNSSSTEEHSPRPSDVSDAVESSVLPHLYPSQIDELAHLVPNIRLHDEDDNDLAAREYRHRTYQQPTVSDKVRPEPQRQNAATRETRSSVDPRQHHQARPRKAMDMSTTDTPPKDGASSGSRSTATRISGLDPG